VPRQTTLEIRIAADSDDAKRRLLDLAKTVQGAGAVATSSERSVTAATKARAKATEEATRAQRAANEEVRRAATASDGAAWSMRRLSKSVQALLGIQLSQWATTAAQYVVSLSDSMARLGARLSLTEGGAIAASSAIQEIYRVAQETAAPLQEVGEAYTRFSRSLARLGATQQQTIEFTEAVTKALRLSGATAAETGSVMLQLGQALDSGRLQGEEFRAIAESGGKVLDYLAQALGVTRGRLREMSSAGELTADALLRITSLMGTIRKDFAAGLPPTVGDAWARLANTVTMLVSQSTVLRAVLVGVAKGLEWVAERAAPLFGGALIAATSLWVASVGGLAAAWRTVAAAIAAARVAALSFAASHPAVLAVTAAVTALVALWDKLPSAIREAVRTEHDIMEAEVSSLERQATRIREAVSAAIQRLDEQIASSRKAMGDSVSAAVSAYSRMEAAAKEAADADVAAVQRTVAAERAAVEDKLRGRVAAYAEIVRIAAEGADRELDVLRRAVEQRAGIIDASADISRRAAAVAVDTERERAVRIAQIDADSAERKRALLAELQGAYRRHIDALTDMHRQHTQAVMELEDRKRQAQLTAEERIREMRRLTMTASQAYADQLAQIDEAMARGRAALAAGQVDAAEEAARAAFDLASRVTGAIEENGRVVVTQQQAVETAIARATAAAALQQQALEAAKRAHAEAAAAAQAAAQTQQQALDALDSSIRQMRADAGQGLSIIIEAETAKAMADIEALQALISSREAVMRLSVDLTEVEEQVAAMRARISEPTASVHEIRDNAARVRAALDELNGRHTSSTHTIYIRRVEQHAAGGLVGAFRRLSGRISGPGTSTSDSIPALLSAGEYVIRADAVRRYGESLFAALNAGRIPAGALPAYAAGGPVQREALTWTIRAGGMEAPVQVVGDDSRRALREMTRELTRIGLLRG
jgi:tape measure domain-containing protein